MTSNPNLGEITDQIIAYESGQLETVEVVELFGHLIKNGMAWSLQGSYGRNAKALIDSGYISKDGEVNYDQLISDLGE